MVDLVIRTGVSGMAGVGGSCTCGWRVLSWDVEDGVTGVTDGRRRGSCVEFNDGFFSRICKASNILNFLGLDSWSMILVFSTRAFLVGAEVWEALK